MGLSSLPTRTLFTMSDSSARMYLGGSKEEAVVAPNALVQYRASVGREFINRHLFRFRARNLYGGTKTEQNTTNSPSGCEPSFQLFLAGLPGPSLDQCQLELQIIRVPFLRNSANHNHTISSLFLYLVRSLLQQQAVVQPWILSLLGFPLQEWVVSLLGSLPQHCCRWQRRTSYGRCLS